MYLPLHKLLVLWGFVSILLMSGIHTNVNDCLTYEALQRNLTTTEQEIDHILDLGTRVHHDQLTVFFSSREKKMFELNVKKEGVEKLRMFLACLATYLKIVFEKIPELDLPYQLAYMATDPDNKTFITLIEAMLQKYIDDFDWINKGIKTSEVLKKYYDQYKRENRSILNFEILKKRVGLSIDEVIPADSFHNISPMQEHPSYTRIPHTSFQCDYMDYVPGFYADVETDCQVFHVCWQNRRESFLCPISTIFNQQTLTCDLWYRSKCQLAPSYYSINEELRLRDYEFMELDEPAYERLLDPYYDSKRYSHTLLVANDEIRYIPIAYRTIFYLKGLFPNSLKFPNFDPTFPEQFGNTNISPEQLNDLAIEIYNEMEKTGIQGPFNEIYRRHINSANFEHFPEDELCSDMTELSYCQNW